MVRFVRPVWAAIAAASALFLFAFSTASLQGTGQAPGQNAGAAAAPSFVGDWVVTVAMGATQSTSIVSVKNDAGKLTATVTPEGQAPVAVPSVAVTNGSLVLKYTLDYQGTPISSVMTLTPETTAGAAGAPGSARVQMAVMDGQYEMSGMAAKQAPGAPLPQRGAGAGGGFGGGRGPQTNENTDFTAK